MPQFNEDIYLGPAIAGGTTTSAGPSPMTQGVGPMARIYLFDLVPAASNTTTGQNEICPSANLPLGAMVCTANGTTTLASYDGFGNAIVVLDCARNIAIYSAADLSTKTITVTGYDQYGQTMSEAITAPNATTVFGKKAFKSVKSVSSSGAIASAVVVGIGTSVGFPYRIIDLGYVDNPFYNQTVITNNSTNVKVADTTSPATTTTGDVRGTLLLGATDGTKRAVVHLALAGIAAGPTATRAGAFGVTQV